MAIPGQQRMIVSFPVSTLSWRIHNCVAAAAIRFGYSQEDKMVNIARWEPFQDASENVLWGIPVWLPGDRRSGRRAGTHAAGENRSGSEKARGALSAASNSTISIDNEIEVGV